jgi:hypothetical protein
MLSFGRRCKLSSARDSETAIDPISGHQPHPRQKLSSSLRRKAAYLMNDAPRQADTEVKQTLNVAIPPKAISRRDRNPL